MLESGKMPPKEATLFPTDAERAAALDWIRSVAQAPTRTRTPASRGA